MFCNAIFLPVNSYANRFHSLTDINNVPETDRVNTTEHSERSTLPRPSNSDSEKRPRSPSTRSVERVNMDSNGSDLRASQRLHLAGLFTRFMSEVSEQTA